VSPELDNKLASHCLQSIGVLQWVVELGWINVHSKMVVAPQHQAMPCEGHLEVAHMFCPPEEAPEWQSDCAQFEK